MSTGLAAFLALLATWWVWRRWGWIAGLPFLLLLCGAFALGPLDTLVGAGIDLGQLPLALAEKVKNGNWSDLW
jgi:hypothetical protein